MFSRMSSSPIFGGFAFVLIGAGLDVSKGMFFVWLVVGHSLCQCLCRFAWLRLSGTINNLCTCRCRGKNRWETDTSSGVLPVSSR